tara:strand:+ start:4232 stop:5191 length:960 start_codon:yes stop_codon:yes gene_type:complete
MPRGTKKRNFKKNKTRNNKKIRNTRRLKKGNKTKKRKQLNQTRKKKGGLKWNELNSEQQEYIQNEIGSDYVEHDNLPEFILDHLATLTGPLRRPRSTRTRIIGRSEKRKNENEQLRMGRDATSAYVWIKMKEQYNNSREKRQREAGAAGAAVYENKPPVQSTGNRRKVLFADDPTLGGELKAGPVLDSTWPELVTSEVEPQTAEVKPIGDITKDAAEEVEKRRMDRLREIANAANKAYDDENKRRATLTPKQKEQEKRMYEVMKRNMGRSDKPHDPQTSIEWSGSPDDGIAGPIPGITKGSGDRRNRGEDVGNDGGVEY